MHGHELLEQFAALVLVTSGAFFLAAAWLARRKVLASPLADRARITPVDRHAASRAADAVTVSLAFGAAVIHLAVVPPHWGEFPPYGIAFAGLAVLQVALGVAVLAGAQRRLWWPAVTVTIGVIVVWTASRTIGLPFGPEAWQPEAIGMADVVATVFEIGLLGMLALGRKVGRAEGSGGASANVVGSIAIVPAVGLLSVTALLVATSVMAEPADDHHHGARAEAVQPIEP